MRGEKADKSSERDIAQEILDAVVEIQSGGGRRFTVPSSGNIKSVTLPTSPEEEKPAATHAAGGSKA